MCISENMISQSESDQLAFAGPHMYLSRMQLDIKKRETMRALSSPEIIHGTVEQAFKGDRKRRLWRIDCLRGKWYLLILSSDKPDLTDAARQFGPNETFDSQFYDRSIFETKDYMQLLNRIHEGDYWHFRLTANPTVSKNIKNEKSFELNRCGNSSSNKMPRGKVFAHQTPVQQKQWLMERADSHGFSLNDSNFEVVHEEWFHFHKKTLKESISLLGVTFEGVLKITDVDLFRKTLTEGIGRGKAYGMGLLTIAEIVKEGELERNE